MNTIVLNSEPLTREAFAPYGDVIETDNAKSFDINFGDVTRFHDLANVDIDYADGARAMISFVTIVNGHGVPFKLQLIERHPKASQAFFPMFDKPVYIVVGLPTKEADPTNLKAFVTNGKQGFNYNAGVWHMPIMSGEKGQSFIVVDRGGPGDNCDEYYFNDHAIELK
jgi:ureidoglycolate lyase